MNVGSIGFSPQDFHRTQSCIARHDTLISILAAQDTSNAVDLSIDIPFDLPRDAEVVGVSCLEVGLLRNTHVDDLVKKLSCIHTPISLVSLIRFIDGGTVTVVLGVPISIFLVVFFFRPAAVIVRTVDVAEWLFAPAWRNCQPGITHSPANVIRDFI